MNSNQLKELNQLKAELEAFHASPSEADLLKRIEQLEASVKAFESAMAIEEPQPQDAEIKRRETLKRAIDKLTPEERDVLFCAVRKEYDAHLKAWNPDNKTDE